MAERIDQVRKLVCWTIVVYSYKSHGQEISGWRARSGTYWLSLFSVVAKKKKKSVSALRVSNTNAQPQDSRKDIYIRPRGGAVAVVSSIPELSPCESNRMFIVDVETAFELAVPRPIASQKKESRKSRHVVAIDKVAEAGRVQP